MSLGEIPAGRIVKSAGPCFPSVRITATSPECVSAASKRCSSAENASASGADPVDYVKGMLAQKKKVPGFGHRVYHTEDPRATHLRRMSQDLGQSSGNAKWFDISRKIEEFVTGTGLATSSPQTIFSGAACYPTIERMLPHNPLTPGWRRISG